MWIALFRFKDMKPVFLTTMYGAAIPPILAHKDEKPTPIVLYKNTHENKQDTIRF